MTTTSFLFAHGLTSLRRPIFDVLLGCLLFLLLYRSYKRRCARGSTHIDASSLEPTMPLKMQHSFTEVESRLGELELIDDSAGGGAFSPMGGTISPWDSGAEAPSDALCGSSRATTASSGKKRGKKKPSKRRGTHERIAQSESPVEWGSADEEDLSDLVVE